MIMVGHRVISARPSKASPSPSQGFWGRALPCLGEEMLLSLFLICEGRPGTGAAPPVGSLHCLPDGEGLAPSAMSLGDGATRDCPEMAR